MSYTRINMKMQLQKEQAEEQKRRSQNQQLNKTTTQSQAILLPNATTTSASVPGEILQVQTNLQHPTRYHVQQKQRNQVANYLSNSVGTSKVVVNQLLRPHHGSLPDAKTTGIGNASGLSAPASPLSRLQLSTSADSQMDDIIDDIVSLESSFGENRGNLSTTLPTIDRSALPTFSMTSAQKLTVYDQNKTSSSCPPEIIPKQEYLDDDSRSNYLQDRVKKDNHNRIERRRRYNINDRIKELGTLVPRNTDPDMRWNKGSILKASVDHMRDLQNRVTRSEKIERNQKQMQNINRRLMLRIQELEMLAKSKGLEVPPLQGEQEIVNTLMASDTPISYDQNQSDQMFTREEEFDVANFPSQSIQTHSPNFKQESHSPSFVIQHSPQQPSLFLTSQPATSPSPNQHQFLQQPQQIISIDITSPAPSISPQPQQHQVVNTSNMTTNMLHQQQQHNNQGLQLSDSIIPFDATTTFSNLLNNSEGVNFDDMLMEEEITPIRSDIFLSDSVQQLQ